MVDALLAPRPRAVAQDLDDFLDDEDMEALYHADAENDHDGLEDDILAAHVERAPNPNNLAAPADAGDANALGDLDAANDGGFQLDEADFVAEFEQESLDWGIASNEGDMDMDDVVDQVPPLPAEPVGPRMHRNPPVVVADWDANDWPDEEAHEELEDALFEDVFSDLDDGLIDGIDQEPVFHEREGPRVLDPDYELEMDEEQAWELFYQARGDLAAEEWLDIYYRHITAKDRTALKFLAARMRSHMSREVYEDLRGDACKPLNLPSDYVAWQRLKFLSRLESRQYDCCIESCVCFLGRYEHSDQCPYCKNPRYNVNGQPRRTYCYTPLIPQLQGLFQNPASIKNMRHRVGHEAAQAADPGRLEDVFDGELYRRLRNTRVSEDSDYCYFNNPDDIALGLGTDGFNMYKRRHKGNSAAWPLILVNYNLHPKIRNRLENIICVGVIPGPKECKDINSFLVPLIDELLELANGVESSKVASDVDNIEEDGAYFVLRAFLIILFGDIPAISKLLQLKGHKGITPCRACLIQGTTLQNFRESFSYYYDLMDATPPGPRRAELARESGLNARPIFHRLGSIDLSCCAPYELMHLLFENLVPNMVMHWKGRFKDIPADAAYLISDNDWEVIGRQSAEATRTIPGHFVGTIPDIHVDMGLYKAEAYAFWFMYLAPILLKDKLAQEYYEHFLLVREIIIWSIDLEITLARVDELERKIFDWVENYERLYYQYDYERLGTCLLTIHALLHIPFFIRQTGPLSNIWCFLMERFCGYLLRPALANRVRPYEYLDNYIRRRAQLQIVARIHDMPGLLRPMNTGMRLVAGELISTKEKIYPGFEGLVLGQPVTKNYRADNRLRMQMSRYFMLAEAGEYTLAEHRARVDWTTLVRYGRFRNASMGDSIRVADLIHTDRVVRDNSYMRYELVPDGNASDPLAPVQNVRRIQYGLALDFFYVEYVRDQATNVREPYLLARVRECQTNGLDATLPENPCVEYNSMYAPELIHLQTVHGAVGRVKTGRNTWAIIDRSRGARTQFNNEQGEPDPELI
ncbi:Transposase family Tnp2 protein [Ceratobasidium sp. AG-Ba]|nr:Transposase family Tnp2 protein [Ceratobasidium sp. AG-Ba]